MLQDIKALYGCKIAAIDGEIGHVKDFYFDDNTWVIRYLVVDTGTWLAGRAVLLTPHAFGKWDQFEGALHIKLSRRQIEGGPSIDTHTPVSRKFEIDYYRYYGWPAYWTGSSMWGTSGYPMVMNSPDAAAAADSVRHHHRDDKHLQSSLAVKGYAIHASDGAIGHVAGFLINDRSWAIHNLVVDAGGWISCKEILIDPAAVERISYEDSTVFVRLSKADIARTADRGLAKAAP
jgi:hypothetical protein